MNYKIEISYDGILFTDISGIVIRDSVEIIQSLYEENSLMPDANNASFRIIGDDTIVPHLLNRGEETVCRISIDDVQVFEGIVSPNCNITTTINGIQPITLRVEDYTISKLKRKFSENIERIGIPICDPLDTQNSAVHIVASMAGVQIDPFTVPTIASIDYQFIAETSETYFDSLYKMLFEFGYMFYFNGMGKLAFYNLGSAPTDLTTITKKLSTIEENITENINTAITRGSKDKITVSWEQRDYYENVVLWKDDAKGSRSGAYWAYRSMGSESGWPCYSDNADDVAYIYYSLPDGEVLYATGVELHYVNPNPTWITLHQALTNYGTKCSFRFWNSDQGGYPRYICNTYVSGNAWVKRSINNSFVYIPDQLLENEVQEEYQYECRYIYSKEHADNFLKILQNYFKYSANTYKTNSYDKYELGDYVRIEDDIHQTFTGYGRIRKIILNNSGSFTYFIEGIDEYVNTASAGFVGEYYPQPVYVTAEKLLEGTLPIVTDDIEVGGGTLANVDHITGSVAGISADTDKLFLGVGTYNSADTPFYVDNSGKFSLKNKLSFDGTNLVVNGSGAFSGLVTATSGSFSGSITSSSGTIGGFTIGASTITGGNLALGNTGNISAGTGNDIARISADDAAYRLWIGNATSSSAPFRVSKTGVLTASGATVSGAITATSGSFTGTITTSNITATGGTIGGLTLGSTTIVGGALTLANTGNITAGTSNDVIRVSADDASYRLWIGNATSTSAPFRVTKAGVLTATGANISGAITATSGSFTGTITTSNITATGGTVGGWVMSSDKLLSSASGARIELNKAKSRVSILDSSENEKVVMGYLEGCQKNGAPWNSTKAYTVGEYVYVGGIVYKCILANTNQTPPNAAYWGVSTDAYTSADYGYWIKPGNSVYFDGALQFNNGNITAKDGNLQVLSGSAEKIRIGIDSGLVGLHLYESSGKVSLNNYSDALRISSDSGYLWLGANNASRAEIYTDRPYIAISKPISVVTGTGSDLNYVWSNDSSGQLKLRTVPSSLWTNSQNTRTTDDVVFNSLSLVESLSITNPTTSNPAINIADTTATSNSQVAISSTSTSRTGGYILSVVSSGALANAGASNIYGMRCNVANTSAVANIINTAIWARATGGSSNYSFWSDAGNMYNNGDISTNGKFSGKMSPANGTGTDSNTVYIKDSNNCLKEKAIYSGVWTGAAATATKWVTGRTISLTGDATGTSSTFDGSANLSITTTIADNSHSHISSNISDIQNIRPVGEMTLWAGTTIPMGWLLCDGQAISRSTYSALWTVIGTTWGVGDGSTTFNLPDMRGACPAGVGTSSGYAQNETISLGIKYDDQVQGHKIETTYLRDSYGGSTGGGVGSFKSNNASTFTSTWLGISGQTIVSDGTNGTPRTGNTTRGKIVGINYIIRY